MLTDADAIRDVLASHGNFAECHLADVRWVDLGITVDLCVNYIWDGTKVRPRILEQPRTVVLRAHLVQEVHVVNTITPAIAREVNRVDWGFSEIAQIVLLDNSPIAQQYSSADNRISSSRDGMGKCSQDRCHSGFP